MTCSEPAASKRVEDYAIGLLGQDERRRLEEHAVGCDDCFQQLYSESLLGAAARGESGGAGAGAVGRTSARRVFDLRSWLAGGALALAASLAVFVLPRPAEPPAAPGIVRGSAPGVIPVPALRGGQALPSELVWQPVEVLDSYRLSLYSAELEPLWTTTVSRPPVTLPEELRSSLEPGSTVYWRVEGTAGDGSHWRSRLVEAEIGR